MAGVNCPGQRVASRANLIVANQETAGQFLEAPTRKLKPSQRCPHCAAVEKKTLAQRRHRCGASEYEEDRDAASTRVVLRWALGTLKDKKCGQELPETA